eukprot:3109-Eustigmatos_ZCMA.PRE.1
MMIPVLILTRATKDEPVLSDSDARMAILSFTCPHKMKRCVRRDRQRELAMMSPLPRQTEALSWQRYH